MSKGEPGQIYKKANFQVLSRRRAHLPTKECCAPGSRESVEDRIFPVRCLIRIPRQGFSGHLTTIHHTRGGNASKSDTLQLHQRMRFGCR